MHREFDRTDRQLLQALQADARLTSSELARQANLSQSPCWRRVRRLEQEGVIAGYQAALDRRALGYGVLAFVTLGMELQAPAQSQAFEDAVHAMPEVVMFHAISGPRDFLLVVVARDLEHYAELLQRRLPGLPGVQHVQGYLSLQEYKGRVTGLPMPP